MSAKSKRIKPSHAEQAEAHPPKEDLSRVAELEKRLEEAEKAVAEAIKERDEQKDRALRTLADFQNFRRRVAQEKDLARAAAVEDMALRLVPLIDDFERALAAAEQAHDLKTVVEGIRLIRSQFETALAQSGVQPIEAVGKPFDPRLHEAVAATESADHEHEEVVEELRRGYILDGKVIRPSRVRVAKKPTGSKKRDG
jgi:molecular chaperone GrpE